MSRSPNNPLALAVMVSLLERPMHPYEVATTLRQRSKERSVKLNYGALYRVVESLHKAGLITPKETEREGRLPERTVYELTQAGRVEVADWLADLISTPATEYPEFGAGLSFMAALPPGQVLEYLKERLRHLAIEEAEASARREHVEKIELPRLLWVDEEYRECLRTAEIEFVTQLVNSIEAGELDGSDWWREAHERGFDKVPPPFVPQEPKGRFRDQFRDEEA